MKNMLNGVLFIILSPLFYALTPIFAKLISADGVNVLTVVFLRFVFASITFIQYLLLYIISFLKKKNYYFLKLVY